MRYVAIGDSFSAGRPGGPLPFPVHLAAALPECELTSLAVLGATTGETLYQQLPQALALAPDMISITCGINNLFVPRPNLERTKRELDELFTRAQAPNRRLVTATYAPFPMLDRLPAEQAQSVRQGIDDVNQALRSAAAASGAYVADVVMRVPTPGAERFEADGLHPSAEAYEELGRRIAERLLSLEAA